MTGIPIHYLQSEALQLTIARFEMGYVHESNPEQLHRDDHYIFFLIDEGQATLRIDFEEVTLGSGSAFYVLPGQVHRPIQNGQAQGWYLAADALLVPEDFRAIFESYVGLQPPLHLGAPLAGQCQAILGLLLARSQEPAPTVGQSSITVSLFQAFAGIIADGYGQLTSTVAATSRSKQLAAAFKKSVAQHFRAQKSPSYYAASLHISENYLNEVVKKATGFPASYWITYQLLLEAKRLLLYTTSEVKEVAYLLGYEDAAYFSKLFKKHAGLGPLAFRAKNVE